MQTVAAAHLQPVITADADNTKQAQRLIGSAVSLHSSRLEAGATPRHYVAFVQLCSKLYTAKREELVQQQKFLKVIHVPTCIYHVCLSQEQTLAKSLKLCMQVFRSAAK